MLLLLLLSACATPQDCALADPADTTLDPGGFYRCEDAQLNGGEGCGPEGYPQAFAARYAEIYMWEVYPQVSERAQQFLDDNLICLQAAFAADTDPEMSCEQVAEAGFAAHPGCYMSSGICELELADKVAILVAIEEEDLGHPAQQAAFEEIAAACAE